MRFIHHHHLLDSCRGNCPAMQYSKKWIRLHCMVRPKESPLSNFYEVCKCFHKLAILKAAVHVLLCFSEEYIHLF